MFKVGDKVKCVDPWSTLALGRVYTVVKPHRHAGHPWISIAELNGGKNCYSQHRFVKVNTFKGNK